MHRVDLKRIVVAWLAVALIGCAADGPIGTGTDQAAETAGSDHGFAECPIPPSPTPTAGTYKCIGTCYVTAYLDKQPLKDPAVCGVKVDDHFLAIKNEMTIILTSSRISNDLDTAKKAGKDCEAIPIDLGNCFHTNSQGVRNDPYSVVNCSSP